MANQTWEFREFPGPRPNGEDNAVIFLNEPARQGRGEATATLRNDGSAGLFYLVPGDLGTSTALTWESREFPSPDGEKNAVIFLNEPARQGPGEATATLRNDGSAGLLYLAPGSLGASTAQTWESGEFAGPKQAVDFLNEPARQGPGQASVTPRNNGSVGLLYLVPGIEVPQIFRTGDPIGFSPERTGEIVEGQKLYSGIQGASRQESGGRFLAHRPGRP